MTGNQYVVVSQRSGEKWRDWIGDGEGNLCTAQIVPFQSAFDYALADEQLVKADTTKAEQGARSIREGYRDSYSEA